MRFVKLFLSIAFLLIINVYSYQNPSQFQKKIFDFKYPLQGLYPISLGNNETMMNNLIRSYGDLNNDLRTDYVAIDNENNTVIYLYNTQTFMFYQSQSIPPQGCNPLNYYLYDSNGDYNLDISVWGINSDGSNCLYMLMNINGSFQANITNTLNLTLTTQPFLIQTNGAVFDQTNQTYVFIFFNENAQERQLLMYLNGSYVVFPWSTLFYTTPLQNYTGLAFSDQHWNTYADITNDCYPDIIITSGQNQTQLQFWIYNPTTKLFSLISTKNPNIQPFNSFSLIDINYDAALDIVISSNNSIFAYLNNKDLKPQSKLCQPSNTEFSFNWDEPLVISVGQPNIIIQQNIQFADLNIDGYPQMMLIVSNGQGINSVLVYENKIWDKSSFQLYTSKYVFNNLKQVISVGFFDILENGIVDIIINTIQSNQYVSQAYYNNYLYQNHFYIKGYGIDGIDTNQGSQIPGVSFYWTNSVGNTVKLAYLTQIPQTAYYSYSMPYVVTGLGRANNYIQYFTVARLGDSRSWTPIIPNSQLAVFIGQPQSNNWAIKIFIMPADSLVYVVIVCVFILMVLGVILMILKWKKKPKIQPLLADL